MTENVYNEQYQIIGVIYTIDSKGTKQIRAANGTQILGTYYPGVNKTADSRGQWIGSGNQLVRLLHG